MTQWLVETGEVYEGQFGSFTISRDDRLGVVIYRGAMAVAALCVAIATLLVMQQGTDPTTLTWITPLFASFSLALGIALTMIHIYMASLHRILQLCWLVGSVAALGVALQNPLPLAAAVYSNFWAMFGVGWIFVALTGVFFKEAFCFNRLEAKALTVLIPLLLLGHWWGWLTLGLEQALLMIWAGLFVIFALRKLTQPIPPDIGDKSVFAYLSQVNQD